MGESVREQRGPKIAMTDRVDVYTDGGCDPNPGPGGWGAVLISGQRRKEISGAAARTTNNRMELTAAIEALRLLARPCEVTVHTDSTYLKRGITEWLPRWQARGWKRASGGSVMNQDLWEALADAASRQQITWRWLKGHRGDPLNERADRLATQARRQLRRNGPAPQASRASSLDQQVDMPAVEVYARGCALGVPGPGGYGAALIQGSEERIVSGAWPLTTSNVMELWAVIAALKSLQRPSRVTIHTASKYVLDGATRWMAGWERHGWRKKDGSPVKNQELWRELTHVLGDHDVQWKHLPIGTESPPSSRASRAARHAALEQAPQSSE